MTAASQVIRQNMYIGVFRAAGAISPETAQTLAEIGVRDSRLFRRMVGGGVFVDVGDGRYYLDPEGTERYLDRRWVKMMVTAIIGLFILVLIMMTQR